MMMGQQAPPRGNHIAEYGLALALVALFSIPAVTYLGDMIGENLKQYKKEDSAHLASMLEKESWAKIEPHDRAKGNGAELELYYTAQGIDPLIGHSDLFNNAESVSYFRDANGNLVIEVDGKAINTMSGNGHLEVLYASMGELEEVLVALAEELNEPDLLALVRAGHQLGNDLNTLENSPLKDQYQLTETSCPAGKKAKCNSSTRPESEPRVAVDQSNQKFGATYEKTIGLLESLESKQEPGSKQAAYLEEVKGMVTGYSQLISAVTYDSYYSGKGQLSPGIGSTNNSNSHEDDSGKETKWTTGPLSTSARPPGSTALANTQDIGKVASKIDLTKSSSNIVHQSSEGIRNAPAQAAINTTSPPTP